MNLAMISYFSKKTPPMLKLLNILACAALSVHLAAARQAAYSVIPEPAGTDLAQGTAKTLKLLSDKAAPSLGRDAYQLTVTPQGAHLSSGGREGRIYGLVTLQQLRDQLAAHPEGIPCGVIRDKPRYPWRGLMVDPARHFIPIKDLKKFVDLMAYYKFNKLQLHLTDDQGWRLPVPGYPKLKSISSKRAESFGNGTPHEGMYTKQELKDLVAYCAARGIEVIPEIDMPGHNQALAAAYPEFFCFPNPDTKVRTTGGVTLYLVCPHKPEIWKFYAAVFDELKDIFPSPIVHLGGDEAPLEKTWEKCPLSIKYRQQKGMKDVHEELKEFEAKMASMLAARGKRVQLWYEKPWAQANIYRKGDTVFTWRMGLTPSTITETKKQGLPLIIAAGEHCYLDYPQIPGQDNRGWMPTTTLEQSYKLDPAYGRPEKEVDHVIGVQATMWAEQLPTLNHLLYRTYPRACAIAEAGWSPMNVRSWENFQRKLEDHRQFVLKRFNYDMERTKENEPPFK